MATLKDKANKKRASRKEKTVIESAPAKVEGVNAPELNSPAEIESQRLRGVEPVTAVTPVAAPVATQMNPSAPKGVYMNTRVQTPNQVIQQNPSVIKNANIEAAKEAVAEANKPLTLSDLLAKQREKAIQEKTDAAKMQKYYALTDAFGTLGKIGGSVVGGAIGGNVMDSAPSVPEYKESRGYLEAFEKAKKANDRLRALDDAEYNLALRDEERTYKQQEAKLEREYRKQLADYEHQLKLAQAQKNADLELEIKTKIENLNHEHRMAQEKLKGDYAIAEKNLSKEIVTIQNNGKGASKKDYVPMAMANGKGVMIPKDYYNDMLDFYTGSEIGGEIATKDNVKALIRKNPQLVNDYLSMFGYTEEAETTESKEVTPKKTPYSGPSSRADYADAAFKKALENGAYDEVETTEELSMDDKKKKWRNRN